MHEHLSSAGNTARAVIPKKTIQKATRRKAPFVSYQVVSSAGLGVPPTPRLVLSSHRVCAL